MSKLNGFMTGTVKKLSEDLGIDREIVYGLVRFLEKTGQIKPTGTEPPARGFGKSSTVYTLPTVVSIDLGAIAIVGKKGS